MTFQAQEPILGDPRFEVAEAMPAPQERELSLEARRWMIGHFCDYITHFDDFPIGSALYSRQRDAVSRLADKLDSTSDADTQGGYYDYPTGGGKSMIQLAIAEGTGVGKIPPGMTEPVRGLLFAPRKSILRDFDALIRQFDETAGLPFRITRYFGGEQDMKGQLLITTDNALIQMDQHTLNKIGRRNLFLGDESHMALGPTTRPRIARLIRGGKIAVGASATVDYHDGKRTAHLFGERIDGTSAREAIEAGQLRPVQLMLLNSGYRVKRVRDGSPEEARRRDPARNQLILDFVKACAENGMQGLVSCIEGSRCEHPDLLVEAAKLMTVYDQSLQAERPLRVAAIHGYGEGTTKRGKEADIERVKMWQRTGKLDAVFYVGMLGIGFHSDKVDYILDAAGTESPVVSLQTLGRLMKKTDQLGVAAQLLDQLPPESAKRQILFFHSLEVDRIEDVTIVGPVKPNNHNGGGKPDSGGYSYNGGLPRRSPLVLPDNLQARADHFAGRLVRDVVLGPGSKERVPEGMTALRGIESLASIIGDRWREAVVDSLGIERERHGTTWYVRTEDLPSLESYAIPDFLDCPPISLADADVMREFLARELGRKLPPITKLIEYYDLIVLQEPGPKGEHYIPETELRRLEAALRDNGHLWLDSKTDVLVATLRGSLNAGQTDIAWHARHRTVDGYPQPIRLYTRRVMKDDGQASNELCINILDAMSIERHFLTEVPEDAVLIGAISNAAGVNAAEALRMLHRRGIARYVRTGYTARTDDSGSGRAHPVQFLPSKIDAAILEQIFGAEAMSAVKSGNTAPPVPEIEPEPEVTTLPDTTASANAPEPKRRTTRTAIEVSDASVEREVPPHAITIERILDLLPQTKRLSSAAAIAYIQDNGGTVEQAASKNPYVSGIGYGLIQYNFNGKQYRPQQPHKDWLNREELAALTDQSVEQIDADLRAMDWGALRPLLVPREVRVADEGINVPRNAANVHLLWFRRPDDQKSPIQPHYNPAVVEYIEELAQAHVLEGYQDTQVDTAAA